MELLGEAVAGRGQPTPLLGVAPASMVTYPGGPSEGSIPDGAPLEPNHSHFVLAPGAGWGSETGTFFTVADGLRRVLAATSKGAPPQLLPIVMVVANGGAVAKAEVLAGVRRRWPIIVVEGSGGLADEIAVPFRQPLDKRDAIDDPDAGGDRRRRRSPFFSAQGPVEGLARLIDHHLRRNETLDLAWQRFALYDANAVRQQKIGNRLQLTILTLGVVATALALLGTSLTNLFGEDPFWSIPMLYHGAIWLAPVVDTRLRPDRDILVHPHSKPLVLPGSSVRSHPRTGLDVSSDQNPSVPR